MTDDERGTIDADIGWALLEEVQRRGALLEQVLAMATELSGIVERLFRRVEVLELEELARRSVVDETET